MSHFPWAQCYYFRVDAISGEVHVIQLIRTLAGEKTAPLLDMALHQNGGKGYDTLAEDAAIKYGAVNSAVKTVEYKGQGAYNNDPSIAFKVTGEDGERAHITLSLFDKKLLSITFEAGVKEVEVGRQIHESRPEHREAVAKGVEESARRAAEYYAAYFDADPESVQSAAEAFADYLIADPEGDLKAEEFFEEYFQ